MKTHVNRKAWNYLYKAYLQTCNTSHSLQFAQLCYEIRFQWSTLQELFEEVEALVWSKAP